MNPIIQLLMSLFGGQKQQTPSPSPTPTPNLGRGNIDLNKRPTVYNPDGSISTVLSVSFNQDGKEVLVPKVLGDGSVVSDREAWRHYLETGQNLGKFDTVKEANDYAQSLHNDQAKQYLPTVTPTPTQQYIRQPTQSPQEQYSPQPSQTPTQQYAQPTVTPIPNSPQNPYLSLIQKYFADQDPNKISNTMFGESSFQPQIAHVNNGKDSFNVMVKSPEQWLSLRQQYPSIDTGLMQINTAGPMSDYLQKQGLTYYDLISNPELNVKVASDLFYGRIPQTAPGIHNWNAAKALGY